MNKIIVVIDGLKYSASATKYAVHLTRQCRAHLVAVFLEDFTYHSYKMYELAGNERSTEVAWAIRERVDKEVRERSVEQFKAQCQASEVPYTIHHDRSIAIQELLHESIYADLLVIDGKESLTHYEEEKPTRFMRDLLGEVQCPVLVVPDQFHMIDKIIFLYDGEPSSVYAMRMFNYLFQPLKHLPGVVLTINADSDLLYVPDNRLVKEYMKRQYPEVEFKVLKGEPAREIIRYVKEEGKNILLVLGAYQRGVVSRWLKHSIADVLMQEVDAPLFIAHG
jgi:hypothetical protein